MDPTDIGLFRMAEQRLSWIDQRQRLLAQNVANANTPGFAARDLAPFEAALFVGGLEQTSPGHLGGSRSLAHGAAALPKAHAPSGNAVSVEDQLSRVADTAGMQDLVIGLHHRYQAMFRTVLGRGG